MRKALKLERDTEVVDAELGPPDSPSTYETLFATGDCRLTRFEPPLVADGFPKARKNERYLPVQVGDGRDHTLQVCAHPGYTSYMEPNGKVLALYPDLKRNAAVTRKVPDLATRRIDDIADIKHIDLLKLSLSGGELAAIQGAPQSLARAVAVHTDLYFVQLYKKQGSPGDIDCALRELGFVLHHMPAAKQFVMAAGNASYVNHGPSTQLITGEAFYLRDLSRHERLDDEQLRHMAIICHHYRAYDEARFCMGLLEKRRAIPRETVLRYMGL